MQTQIINPKKARKKFNIALTLETSDKLDVESIMEIIKHTLTSNSDDRVIFIRVTEVK